MRTLIMKEIIQPDILLKFESLSQCEAFFSSFFDKNPFLDSF